MIRPQSSRHPVLQCLHNSCNPLYSLSPPAGIFATHTSRSPSHHQRLAANMKGALIAAALSLQAGLSAAICIPLSVGDVLSTVQGSETYPDEFTLSVSLADGSQSYGLAVAETPEPGSFFYNLTLAEKNATQSDLAQFQLSGGSLYTSGGVLATQANFILFPQRLYAASDSTAVTAFVEYVNATCDGKPSSLLRFVTPLGLPLGRGDVADGFAPGSGINSPILVGLLGMSSCDLVRGPRRPCRPRAVEGLNGQWESSQAMLDIAPVDLIIHPLPSTDARRRRRSARPFSV